MRRIRVLLILTRQPGSSDRGGRWREERRLRKGRDGEGRGTPSHPDQASRLTRARRRRPPRPRVGWNPARCLGPRAAAAIRAVTRAVVRVVTPARARLARARRSRRRSKRGAFKCGAASNRSEREGSGSVERAQQRSFARASPSSEALPESKASAPSSEALPEPRPAAKLCPSLKRARPAAKLCPSLKRARPAAKLCPGPAHSCSAKPATSASSMRRNPSRPAAAAPAHSAPLLPAGRSSMSRDRKSSACSQRE
jgi:hypothetical protein